jgi:Methyltransferase domain
LGKELDFDVCVPVTSPSSSTSLLERLCLGMLLKLQNPATIFELGTYRGATTLFLFKNISEGAKLYSFDIPNDIGKARTLDRTKLISLKDWSLEDDFCRDFFPKSDRVIQVYADLMEVDWEYIRELPKPDFVFVDAYHSYEACLRDTKNIIGWVGDEAMVVWHDASWKKFVFLENNYGVHSSIVDGTSSEAISYTFRIKDTTLMVRSKAHEALFRRNLVR